MPGKIAITSVDAEQGHALQLEKQFDEDHDNHQDDDVTWLERDAALIILKIPHKASLCGRHLDLVWFGHTARYFRRYK